MPPVSVGTLHSPSPKTVVPVGEGLMRLTGIRFLQPVLWRMGWIPTVACLGMRGLHASRVKITHSRIGVITTQGGLGTNPGGKVCPSQWHFLCFQMIRNNRIAEKPRQPIGCLIGGSNSTQCACSR